MNGTVASMERNHVSYFKMLNDRAAGLGYRRAIELRVVRLRGKASPRSETVSQSALRGRHESDLNGTADDGDWFLRQGSVQKPGVLHWCRVYGGWGLQAATGRTGVLPECGLHENLSSPIKTYIYVYCCDMQPGGHQASTLL